MNRLKFILLIVQILLLNSCLKHREDVLVTDTTDQLTYYRAIQDAMVADDDEIYNNLADLLIKE